MTSLNCRSDDLQLLNKTSWHHSFQNLTALHSSWEATVNAAQVSALNTLHVLHTIMLSDTLVASSAVGTVPARAEVKPRTTCQSGPYSGAPQTKQQKI